MLAMGAQTALARRFEDQRPVACHAGQLEPKSVGAVGQLAGLVEPDLARKRRIGRAVVGQGDGPEVGPLRRHQRRLDLARRQRAADHRPPGRQAPRTRIRIGRQPKPGDADQALRRANREHFHESQDSFRCGAQQGTVAGTIEQGNFALDAGQPAVRVPAHADVVDRQGDPERPADATPEFPDPTFSARRIEQAAARILDGVDLQDDLVER